MTNLLLNAYSQSYMITEVDIVLLYPNTHMFYPNTLLAHDCVDYLRVDLDFGAWVWMTKVCS